MFHCLCQDQRAYLSEVSLSVPRPASRSAAVYNDRPCVESRVREDERMQPNTTAQ
jgi:hypothetical protein